jgi:hypothetical protein
MKERIKELERAAQQQRQQIRQLEARARGDGAWGDGVGLGAGGVRRGGADAVAAAAAVDEEGVGENGEEEAGGERGSSMGSIMLQAALGVAAVIITLTVCRKLPRGTKLCHIRMESVTGDDCMHACSYITDKLQKTSITFCLIYCIKL